MIVGYAVRPKADLDLDEIADYLAEQSSLETGLSFLAEAHRTFTLLTTQPALGWRCKVDDSRLTGVRVFRVGSPFMDYLIFYQYQLRGECIEILRVLHGSRDLVALFGKQDVRD